MTGEEQEIKCKWQEEKHLMYVPDCYQGGLVHVELIDSWTYCPFCGKKISVVEE
jgi:hypothetical protein